MSDFQRVKQLSNLSSDLDQIFKEMRDVISHIKNPILVDQANTFMDSFEDALTACDESIDEFNNQEEESLSSGNDDESEEMDFRLDYDESDLDSDY